MKQCVNTKYQNAITSAGCRHVVISVASGPKLRMAWPVQEHLITLNNAFQLRKSHQNGRLNGWLQESDRGLLPQH